MKNLLFGLLILFSLVATVSAQTVEAIKVDEMKAMPCDYLQGNLDNFFTQIMNNSETAKGYIIVYEGKVPSYKKDKTVNPPRGYAKSWIQTVKNHMEFRVIDNKKIIFINGGLRKNFTVELWLVPNTATPPQASPTLTKMRYRKGRATDICEGL